MVSSISQSSLLGIQRGLQQVTAAASNIATSVGNIDAADFATNMVELKQAEQQVAASTMALKIEDQVRGSLLDIRV